MRGSHRPTATETRTDWTRRANGNKGYAFTHDHNSDRAWAAAIDGADPPVRPPARRRAAVAGVPDLRRPDGPRPRRAPGDQVEPGRDARPAAFVRHGVCGSDAMRINNVNALACKMLVKSLAGDTVTVEPILGLPVIKDLIVDMKPFFDHYKSVMPYLVNDDPPPTTERLQSPEERARFDDTTKCILCACCTTACPPFWGNQRVRRAGLDRQRAPLHLRLSRPRRRRSARDPQRRRGRLALPDGVQLHQRLPARHPRHQGDPGGQARDAHRQPGIRASVRDRQGR